MTSCLLITADQVLQSDVEALIAAAGLSSQHCIDPSAGLALWSEAEVVLVGADLVDQLAALGPPRRDRTHVVTAGVLPDSIYRQAMAIGARLVLDVRADAEWLSEELAALADPDRRAGYVVGVIAGSGGAGASVFAAALGQVAGRAGADAVVIDADPIGPGQDRLLGLDDVPGVRWDALHHTTGRLSSVALRESVPRRHGVGVLAWPPGEALSLQAFAAREALAAAQRGHDLVVLDLPRRGPGLVAELAARCDAVAVLARPSLSGVAATAALLRTFDTSKAGLVLRTMTRSIDETDVGLAVGLPIWAVMSDQRGLDEAIDLGRGPAAGRGPLTRTARLLVSDWLEIARRAA